MTTVLLKDARVVKQILRPLVESYGYMMGIGLKRPYVGFSKMETRYYIIIHSQGNEGPPIAGTINGVDVVFETTVAAEAQNE